MALALCHVGTPHPVREAWQVYGSHGEVEVRYEIQRGRRSVQRRQGTVWRRPGMDDTGVYGKLYVHVCACVRLCVWVFVDDATGAFCSKVYQASIAEQPPFFAFYSYNVIYCMLRIFPTQVLLNTSKHLQSSFHSCICYFVLLMLYLYWLLASRLVLFKTLLSNWHQALLATRATPTHPWRRSLAIMSLWLKERDDKFVLLSSRTRLLVLWLLLEHFHLATCCSGMVLLWISTVLTLASCGMRLIILPWIVALEYGT